MQIGVTCICDIFISYYTYTFVIQFKTHIYTTYLSQFKMHIYAVIGYLKSW